MKILKRMMNSKMKELKIFPECDGHIESIVIGYRSVKVSFQTWNSRKLVLIYGEVDSINDQSSVFLDIGLYETTQLESGFTKYAFYDTDNNLILDILAKSIQIYEVGEKADINSALFDIGYDYVGDQCGYEY